ncbi:MAG: adenine phosphoribosyltransferase [Spartobacteria bacterium]|nr:adenine phosphoribosyltransferase [Spartobacteria bacterium]
MILEKIKESIRDVPDFPVPGVLFKDITPVLECPETFRGVIDLFADRYDGVKIDKIAAVDARGFLFGAALAYKLGIGLIPVRKKGKLPYTCEEMTYDLEYGTNTLTLHTDAIHPGERVLIIDDLLATGGTADASAKLVEKLGGEVVELAFLIELAFLNGRDKLKDYTIFAPIVF